MQKLLFLLIAFSCCRQLSAQNPASAPKQPRFIFLTGVGFHLFQDDNRTFLVTAEYRLNRRVHLGLIGNYYFSSSLRYDASYFYGGEYFSGREYGAYAKFMLNKNSRYKVFIGPEIRFGSRHFEEFLSHFHLLSERYATSKYLGRTGVQWRFKHAVWEIGSGAGWEKAKSGGVLGQEVQFCLLPYFQLGLAL